VAIVLPGFLLRSLIPIGFMPAFGPGLSVRLMLCAGYAPIAAMAVSTAMDMPLSGGSHSPTHQVPNHQVPTHQDHSACPYGASPALAALTYLAVVLPIDPPSLQALERAPQIIHYEIPARAQLPRGPPLQA